ncbi:MAG: hypothetical protein RL574_1564, partial [Actinomycetota bacterium]
EWAFDLRGAVWSAEHLQRAFATVGQRHLNAVVAERLACDGDCLSHLGGRCGSAKLVDCREHPHGF